MSRASAAWHRARPLAQGASLAAVLALAATYVAELHGGPQLLYALLFGVAFHGFQRHPELKPGLEFCGRAVLRLGVGLLGARVTLSQVAQLGWATVTLVAGAIVTTMLVALLLARRLGLSRAQGTLCGGAVAICGASAALAIAAVLPREKDGPRFTLAVVVTVTLLSTVAMVAYPLVARALQLPPDLAGVFLGATIHDVAQVVGAGYMLGPESGDVATVVKLLRVSALTLVVLVTSAVFKRARSMPGSSEAGATGTATARLPALLPWFLWLFVALVLVNSAGLLPAQVQAGLGDV
jgi:uncharacterized integral membrane protein (TIGR00698 family)